MTKFTILIGLVGAMACAIGGMTVGQYLAGHPPEILRGTVPMASPTAISILAIGFALILIAVILHMLARAVLKK